MIDNAHNGLVSVILPAFNCEATVEDAVQSILSQSYQLLELIVVDDGSDDNTSSVINRAACSDKRVKVIRNNKNIGLVKSLNIALDFSNGEYIFRMDADDVSHPERIHRQLRYMIDNDLDLCGTAFGVFGDEVDTAPRFYFDFYDLLLAFCSTNPFAHGSVCYRKSIFFEKGLGYKDCKAEDLNLWAQVIESNLRIGYVNEVLYYYRSSGDGLYAKNRSEIVREARRLHGIIGRHIQSEISPVCFASKLNLYSDYSVSAALALFVQDVSIIKRCFPLLSCDSVVRAFKIWLCKMFL